MYTRPNCSLLPSPIPPSPPHSSLRLTHSQMQLAIYGREPADTLLQWAESLFANITDRNITAPTFPVTSFPNPAYTRRIVYYRPVAATNSIELFWQTPPLTLHYRQAVSGFLSRYLGDEGPGSLLHYLQSKNWASGLSAGTEVDTDSYTLFTVGVALTPAGLPHVGEVVAAVFQFVRLLQDQDGSRLAELWESGVSVDQLRFDYRPKSKPSDYVV